MTVTLFRKSLAVGMVAALVGGCAAKYQMRDDGWGYEGTFDRSGMRAIGVFEGQSQCATRQTMAFEMQRLGAPAATLGQCEPMAVVPPGSAGTTESYWGFGVPSDGVYLLFRDQRTCDLFQANSSFPVWKKTTCGLVGLKRGR